MLFCLCYRQTFKTVLKVFQDYSTIESKITWLRKHIAQDIVTGVSAENALIGYKGDPWDSLTICPGDRVYHNDHEHITHPDHTLRAKKNDETVEDVRDLEFATLVPRNLHLGQGSSITHRRWICAFE